MLSYFTRWLPKKPSPESNPQLEPEPHLAYLKTLYEQLTKHCTYEPLHAQSKRVTVFYPNAQIYLEELLLLGEWMRMDRDVRTVAEYKTQSIRVDDWFVNSKQVDVPVLPWVGEVAQGWVIVDRELKRIQTASETSGEYYLRRASSLLEDGLTIGMYLRR